MKVLFFGQVRERLATQQISVTSPPQNILLLRQELAERGEVWFEVLHQRDLLVAVNQTLCDDKQEITSTDEVAFFPPVTGG
ncbi:MoaD/ThiS family protein [Aliiglaciecola litoralis]|uniref:Molybdopterin synthase sulfur carrier subunit n=1 Tax=Aliiglaciecola litoralis TaxID=582857 RepID=A0ABN1LCC0_9ALTE